MNERGEVVGFADYMAAGEGCAATGDGAAANTAQKDDAVLATARLLGELLANDGCVGAFSVQIEHDDVWVMFPRERETFVGGFGFENLHPATSKDGAQDFSIVG